MTYVRLRHRRCCARIERGRSNTRVKKKPVFPLGCVIVCYATMSSSRIAGLIRWSEESVVSYLRQAGVVSIRPRGGPHNTGRRIARRHT